MGECEIDSRKAGKYFDGIFAMPGGLSEAADAARLRCFARAHRRGTGHARDERFTCFDLDFAKYLPRMLYSIGSPVSLGADVTLGLDEDHLNAGFARGQVDASPPSNGPPCDSALNYCN